MPRGRGGLGLRRGSGCATSTTVPEPRAWRPEGARGNGRRGHWDANGCLARRRYSGLRYIDEELQVLVQDLLGCARNPLLWRQLQRRLLLLLLPRAVRMLQDLGLPLGCQRQPFRSRLLSLLLRRRLWLRLWLRLRLHLQLQMQLLLKLLLRLQLKLLQRLLLQRLLLQRLLLQRLLLQLLQKATLRHVN